MIRKFFDWLDFWVEDDDNNTFIGVGKILLVIVVFFFILLAPFVIYEVYEENAHPCYEWGELYPHRRYIMVGKIMVPVTRMERDCIARR